MREDSSSRAAATTTAVLDIVEREGIIMRQVRDMYGLLPRGRRFPLL